MHRMPVFFLLLLISVCCTPAFGQKAKRLVNSDKQALVLSFYSVGSGINGPAFGDVHDAIDRYNKKYTPKLKYFEKQWGMEGEHNICFPPQRGTHFKQFIKALEKQCIGYEHVKVLRNVPCVD